jgi:CubicO group peptidase (beta-lactamase class C family)
LHPAILIAPAVLAAAGFVYFLRIAKVGAAYKAKVLASALFVSRRDLDLNGAPEVSQDGYKIMRLFGASVDREAHAVTCSFLGMSAKTAVFRPGLGATLASKRGLFAPANPPPEPSWEPDPWEAPAKEPEALARFVDEAFTEPNPKKLRRTRAVLVVKDGKIVAERYAPGFSKDTPMAGWSMTKGVLGDLIGIAVGQGKLSLTGQALLPEWTSQDDLRALITLEDLLRMRSGLKFSEAYANPLSDVNQMLWDSPDAAAYASARLLEVSPGSKWQYASGTTNILSRILRLALGEEEYHAFPRRALFEPLGMHSAVMEPDAAGNFVGSSHMFATARDWARLGLLHLYDGQGGGKRILPKGWTPFAASPKPQSADRRYGGYWWANVSQDCLA